MRQIISDFFGSCFATTKRSLWLPAVLVLAFATCAHADPVPTFKVTTVVIDVVPGLGDNMGMSWTGPGTDLAVFGGTGCFDWCAGFFFELPPQIGLPGQTTGLDSGQFIFDGFSPSTIGGIEYDPLDLTTFFFFNIGQITFPSNGAASFSTCTTANVSGSVSGNGNMGLQFSQFNLTLPSNGTFCSSWGLESDGIGQNAYIFLGGQFVSTTTPEPAPLLLLGTGLLALPFVRRFVG